MIGGIAATVLMTGFALALLAGFGAFAFRRAGQPGLTGGLWRSALVLVGALAAWALLDRSAIRDLAVERRAVEARAVELTARAMAPGSTLACIDAVAIALVESACEKLLFASPEAVAAAVAYVDARVSLFIASVALAERDLSLHPSLERLRRGIEGDRFGLVAHVLKTRGCNSPDCAELRILRDTARILANMKSSAFEGNVGAYAAAWSSNGAMVAATPPPATPVPQTWATTGAAPSAPAGPSAPVAAVSPKYDFPSADSIPAVSIMNAEPAGPPSSEPRDSAAPPKPSAAQPPRRRPPREPAPAAAPPLAVTPQPAAPAPAQSSGAR